MAHNFFVSVFSSHPFISSTAPPKDLKSKPPRPPLIRRPPYTIGCLSHFAKTTFKSTTGTSPIIMQAHESQSDDFFSQPITPDSVGQFVQLENQAIASTPLGSPQDVVAFGATPVRGPIAHFIGQNVTIIREGYNSDNEYSREALLALISPY
ncbi:hypothetical protein MPB2EB_0807 [Mycoavidus sp. B2-EB]|nr:hypothetical protein MPB2EB_0807 [Mycoavidus sp. B2-EB]